MPTILAATGHRPHKLGGYGMEIELKLKRLAREYITAIKPDEAISGMALGWDMAFAEATIELGIPLTAAIPHTSQANSWPVYEKQKWLTLISKSSIRHVQMFSFGSVNNIDEAFKARNEWMVNRCNHLVALWNGSPSGTGHCVSYARRQKRPDLVIVNLWNKWIGGSNAH